MKKVRNIILMLAFALSFGIAALPTTANASNILTDVCTDNPTSSICTNKDTTLSDKIITVVNTLLYVLGVVAVLMIIFGGILYIVSGGDAANVKKAKDTIMYAVIGLVVAILSYAIVNYVIGTFTPKPAESTPTTQV